MKLRNKKTGEVMGMSMAGDIVWVGNYRYSSLADLNAAWEDYAPKEPLIKDEKNRKAIRAWLSIQEQPITRVSVMCTKDHDDFFCYHLYGYIDKARIVDGKAIVNNNLTSIDFEFRSKEGVKYDSRRDYTIAELCGEKEAPEPLEPSFIDLDERIKKKASAEKLYKGENDMHLAEEEE